MKIKPAGFSDFHKVASEMREADFREFSAVSAAKDRAELAAALADRFGWRDDLIGAYAGEEPVAVGALVEARPNVVSLLFLANDRFPAIAFALTRFIVQRLFRAIRRDGVHRIECVSSAEHTDAHRWIEALGLKKEAEMPGYGRAGETFFMYAWVADHVRPAGA